MKRAKEEMKKPSTACIVALLLAAAATIPPTHPIRPALSNDSVEYLSTALHMAAGDGFLSDLKLYLCSPGPVVHSALGEREPAYPAAIALWLRGWLRPAGVGEPGLTAAILASMEAMLIAALGAAAIVALAWELFGAGAAWACVPFAALAPALVHADTTVGPTGLYILWLVLFVLAVIASAKHVKWAVAAGLLWALMALTRGEGTYVGVAGLVWIAAGINARPTGKARVVAVVAGVFVAAMIPYFVMNAHANGSPFFSLASMHLRVRTFSACMWYGYGRKLPAAAAFISTHLPFVVGLSVRNFVVYALSLLRLSWLGAGMAVLAYAIVRARKEWPAEGLILALVGGVQCLAIAMMWSTTSGRAEPKHLAPPLLALAIPAVGWAIWKASRGKAWVAAIIVAVAVATYLPTRWLASDVGWGWSYSSGPYAVTHRVATRYLGSEGVIASGRPWQVWWMRPGPTVILPRDLTRDEQVRYLREYRVRAIVAWPSEAKAWLGLPGVRLDYRDPRGRTADSLLVDQAKLRGL